MSKKDKDPKGSDIDAPDETPAPGEVAEVAEVDGAETIEVEWNDRVWQIPTSPAGMSVVAHRGLRDIAALDLTGQVSHSDALPAADILEELLGPAQFRTWLKAGKNGPIDALVAVLVFMGTAWGTNPGE